MPVSGGGFIDLREDNNAVSQFNAVLGQLSNIRAQRESEQRANERAVLDQYFANHGGLAGAAIQMPDVVQHYFMNVLGYKGDQVNQAMKGLVESANPDEYRYQINRNLAFTAPQQQEQKPQSNLTFQNIEPKTLSSDEKKDYDSWGFQSGTEATNVFANAINPRGIRFKDTSSDKPFNSRVENMYTEEMNTPVNDTMVELSKISEQYGKTPREAAEFAKRRWAKELAENGMVPILDEAVKRLEDAEATKDSWMKDEKTRNELIKLSGKDQRSLDNKYGAEWGYLTEYHGDMIPSNADGVKDIRLASDEYKQLFKDYQTATKGITDPKKKLEALKAVDAQFAENNLLEKTKANTVLKNELDVTKASPARRKVAIKQLEREGKKYLTYPVNGKTFADLASNPDPELALELKNIQDTIEREDPQRFAETYKDAFKIKTQREALRLQQAAIAVEQVKAEMEYQKLQAMQSADPKAQQAAVLFDSVLKYSLSDKYDPKDKKNPMNALVTTILTNTFNEIGQQDLYAYIGKAGWWKSLWGQDFEIKFDQPSQAYNQALQGSNIMAAFENY